MGFPLLSMGMGLRLAAFGRQSSAIIVSGIPGGNKLIKRHDIFTCEDIDDFTDVKFVSSIVLKLIGYHQNIFGSS